MSLDDDFNIDEFLKINHQSHSHNSNQLFGIDKDFFMDLFMPKDSNFQNKVMDLTLDDNRFVYYPFVFPDPDTIPKLLTESHKQKMKKLKKKAKQTRFQEQDDASAQQSHSVSMSPE